MTAVLPLAPLAIAALELVLGVVSVALLTVLAVRWLRGQWRAAQGIRMDASGDDDSRD